MHMPVNRTILWLGLAIVGFGTGMGALAQDWPLPKTWPLMEITLIGVTIYLTDLNHVVNYPLTCRSCSGSAVVCK
jgi:hypothetical protein